MAEDKAPEQDFEVEVSDKDDEVLEVVDDTPEEDRGRAPLPREVMEELESDDLEEYSEKVKTRLKQMKKVYHDERREKERALREHQEAISVAQRILDENRRLKSTLSSGEKTLLDTYKQAAELEMEMAKRAYKEAYESGDTDRVVEAQEKLNSANLKVHQVHNYRPTLQFDENDVQSIQQPIEAPRLDNKTIAWQERNQWWGTDPEMTASALGLHQKLERENGRDFVGTDEYWSRIDKTMRHRFPEYFGGDVKTANGGGKPVTRNETKLANVVAPATRSTSSKKIVLRQSQVNIAKRLGLTPEQYAKEILKLENANG
jgi:hypothetical protein